MELWGVKSKFYARGAILKNYYSARFTKSKGQSDNRSVYSII
jgi:hypothetical protein